MRDGWGQKKFIFKIREEYYTLWYRLHCFGIGHLRVNYSPTVPQNIYRFSPYETVYCTYVVLCVRFRCALEVGWWMQDGGHPEASPPLCVFHSASGPAKRGIRAYHVELFIRDRASRTLSCRRAVPCSWGAAFFLRLPFYISGNQKMSEAPCWNAALVQQLKILPRWPRAISSLDKAARGKKTGPFLHV